MADTALVISSVFVAGVVGPGITAWATTRSQRRLFGHEREMRDRDDRRELVDDLVEALNGVAAATLEAYGRSVVSGPDAAAAPSHVVEATRLENHANLLRARLALRIGKEHEAIVACRRAVEAWVRLLNWVDVNHGMGRFPHDFKDFEQTDSWREEARTLNTRFVDTATEVVDSSALPAKRQGRWHRRISRR